MKKRNIFFLIIFFIILVIILITFLKADNNHDSKVIKCIAEKSKLYVSKTCGHCAGQKEILGEYLDLFEVIDCTTETQKCIDNEILYVPTWLINGEKYTGKKSISELKELTRC